MLAKVTLMAGKFSWCPALKKNPCQSGLKITAGQWTMSDQYDHLSTQTFTLLVILTRSGTFSGPHFHTLHFKRTSIFFQVFTSMSLLVRLACSNYYGVIFKILTGQKRDVSQLKFLWPVNTTGNGPKFILSPTSTYTFLCLFVS